jgi:hypothetical protein
MLGLRVKPVLVYEDVLEKVVCVDRECNYSAQEDQACDWWQLGNAEKFLLDFGPGHAARILKAL